ncbi:MAG TPA: tetratricopeptide repeat protein, partial [Terriglobales bacterium]|nr:tetratricopeptide repeat protein [Terriglobales bacterium]
EYAYNNLGRAYWADRKYDQAVDAFQKQLNVNPLDKYSHANLGALYLEWHKYDQAAAELEKAISLNSQDPMLYVALGRAYLNLDKPDQAVTIFDHAVQLAPSPLVWNDIAYELSLKKSHLDQAQRYAESAVASVAAASRNISLAQLRPQDPLVMTALAAYWDTLGWVHFAQGDYSNAEKYVDSAWMLAQSATVGDHLAQIYEKLGEKDRAIQTYALAMNCTRPDPETRGRLAALLGGDNKVDAIVKQAGPELGKTRTVHLANSDRAAGTADLFVLLSPGEKDADGKLASRVEDVKFVSGDEKLSAFAEPLKAAKFSFFFPDAAPAKVLRRGKLTCTANADCTFALYLLEDVRSIH